jgi:hypothetical protein
MATQPDRYPTVAWRKSSASGGAGECVEVARADSFVLARDSKDRSGVVLEFTAGQWLGLLRRIKNGEACRS